MRFCARTFLIVGLGLAVLPGLASGQTLRGKVVDGGTQAAVGGVTLRLIDEDSRVVAAVLADDAGDFSVTAPAAGEYRITTERLGYAGEVFGPVRLRPNGFLDVTLSLSARAIPLDSIDVAVARVPLLERNGFYDRKGLGNGRFIERAEIERKEVRHAGELLQGVQGIRVVTEAGFTDIQIRNSMADVFRGGGGVSR